MSSEAPTAAPVAPAPTSDTSTTAGTVAAGNAVPGTVPEPSPYGAMLPLVLILIVMYFIVIRPQQKKIKDHADMIKNLRRGDKVVTGGGIIGTVVKIDDDAVQVEIAPDMRVKVVQESISSLLTKPVPAKDNDKADKKEKKSANDN
jgi:preprotein translocase subunit YajC